MSTVQKLVGGCTTTPCAPRTKFSRLGQRVLRPDCDIPESSADFTVAPETALDPTSGPGEGALQTMSLEAVAEVTPASCRT
jgi:hypothetical protein